jgi:hypothetical protein
MGLIMGLVIAAAMLTLTTTSDVFAGNINGMVAGLEGEWVYNGQSGRLCPAEPDDPILPLCINAGEGRTCQPEPGKLRYN